MANNYMQKWYDAAKKRSSVRSYTGAIEKDTFYELKNFAQELSNDDARIELRAKSGVLSKPILQSILGGVEGTNCFAAVIVRNGNDYMGGYLGEAFVLECAARGIGTCWLGASFKRSAAKQFIDLEDDEKIVCVISFGKCSEFPKSPAKRSVEQLTGLSMDDFKARPKWQQEAVKIAKLAPSARNRQPWEIDLNPDYIGIMCNSNNFGFGDLDCGIAMLHLELGAAKCGVSGDWEMSGVEKRFVPFNAESDQAQE